VQSVHWNRVQVVNYGDKLITNYLTGQNSQNRSKYLVTRNSVFPDKNINTKVF
jgi:hypothetical protein